MQQRLKAIGQRPISALVDITNYVMFDLNRPLHAYDGEKISGDKLEVRFSNKDEKIITLNEKGCEISVYKKFYEFLIKEVKISKNISFISSLIFKVYIIFKFY